MGLARQGHADLLITNDPTSATVGSGEMLEEGQQGSVKTPEKSTLADSGGQEPENGVQLQGEADIEDESSKQLM